ncbi:7-deoxyloganetic acid glucosyltransferase-like isoform X2 [Silene latifolia]|uniref:7-deoxyloganetic acid glucosyltransferase-like isoform X2 n=1 Tax=Silene latifolia TaxID=37657 RepID=UPI003D77F917
MEHQNPFTPHVVLIPTPMQGHVTPTFHLAELLCLAKLNVTLLTSTYVHQRINKSIEARFARYPGFKLEAVSDGLPDDYPRTGKDGCWASIQGFALTAQPFLREMLSSVGTSVTCLLVDGWLGFANNLAKEFGIPLIAIRCFSAAYYWLDAYLVKLIEDERIPFKEEDMDKLVENVPGLDTFLRNRDLPSFCRTKDRATCLGLQQAFADEVQRTSEAYGLILNTFEDLEGPLLSLLRSKCPRVYSIGPLHSHLKHRLDEEKTTLPISSSSLWEVDQSCLSWLDKKPAESVIYVGFGSLTILEKEQILEIWEGLVQSNKYFLWVIRPNLVIGGENGTPTPTALLEGTKERGCIVSWAPQEAVLAHPAVGGFLTHSGWNSTLESITAGVPMLCWPYFADQQVNSRYVGEVWKIGLDMKDKCDRKVVAEMVNDVLDRKKDELKESMARMSEAAKKSVTEGGSSYCNLDRLIQDIKMMSIKGAD